MKEVNEIKEKVNELSALIKQCQKEHHIMVSIQIDPFNHMIEVNERPDRQGFHEVDMGDSGGTHFESDDGMFGFGMFDSEEKDS